MRLTIGEELSQERKKRRLRKWFEVIAWLIMGAVAFGAGFGGAAFYHRFH